MGLGEQSSGLGLTHRDDEGQCVDHLQDESHMEDLLPDVALGTRETSEPARGRGRAIGQPGKRGLGT